MRRTILLLLIAPLITWGIVGVAQEEKQKVDPEKGAWQKVDQMDPAALKEFLKEYPDGDYAADAEFDLSLHKEIQDIRDGKIKPPWLVSFEKLGERWQYWQKANPKKGAVGIYRNESTAGIFRALGSAIISTDYSGMVMVPTGDGSILAIETSGLPYRYIGDIVFQTDKDEIMYFGVLHGKGLVYLHGKGKVTTPDGKETVLKSNFLRPTKRSSGQRKVLPLN